MGHTIIPKVHTVINIALNRDNATDWSVEVDGKKTVFSSKAPVRVEIPDVDVKGIIVVENRTRNPMWVDKNQQLWMLDQADDGKPTKVPMDPPPQPPTVSIAVTQPLIHPPEQGRATS